MIENINNIMMEETFINVPSEQILKAVSNLCRGQLLIYPNSDISVKLLTTNVVAWPSGLRRWFKAISLFGGVGSNPTAARNIFLSLNPYLNIN
ncbi:hypothetical protein CEXT_102101 [Caerostris extrusa]|uniref:Uncharacterized protein n=1 Tax=Caerostris extrusa TaxID=172846 RepID=A0AAV4V2R0_CAEEX|nr:hypothetical protein CEXT_102101 [Caerostris extrusa]